MIYYADQGNSIYKFGVKVRASCVSGFQLVNGSKEQSCLENGTWDGVKPVCGKIICNDTSILSFRFQKSVSLFSFSERGTALYNSSKYYLLNGSLSFICLANRSLSWEFQPPELASVCKVQHKDNLLVNAKNCLREDTCEIGTRVSYDCVGDYEVSVRSASCKADHTWSAEPFCKYNAQSAKSSVATIGASIGGIAVVIAAIVLILFICRHRSNAAKSSTHPHYEIPVKKDADQSNCYSEINVSEIINVMPSSAGVDSILQFAYSFLSTYGVFTCCDKIIKCDDAALSRSNSYLTPVVTDGNYYETVSPYECVD
ncbi:sushi, von Willebrand factor type A, EGF and pentraxin domain-containing protein 1-like [Mya arenaria]|uniref:sushi, von Willebrand factor type A, EGF and pentraxin domain-containing protein 1-like n=1 Tax=Mya arenaria TaxID=6604 RepID=UPI0022E8CD0A|nr:sushi, von Willebrand factor type A, EGF and pentraxin domain-containing protein 1-like [Mya arenaria]